MSQIRRHSGPLSGYALRGRTIGTFVLLAGTALVCGCGLVTSTATVMKRAQHNLAVHDYRAAIVDLENLVQKRPNDRDLRLMLARSLLHTGSYVEAEGHFRRAQQLGAPWSAVTEDLAEARLGEGMPQQALDLLDAHPPSGKPDSRTLTLRGRALLAIGRRDEARTVLTQAISQDSGNASARVALATVLDSQGDEAGAKAALTAAAAAQPTDFSPHLMLGAWYIRARDPHAAHSELTRALSLAVAGVMAGSEPWFDEYRVLVPLANTDLALGDIASANASLQRLRKLSSHSTPTLLLQARVELAEKHPSEARTALQELLSRDPQNIPGQVLMGEVDATAGELGQADMYLTAALAAAPNDLAARSLLTQVQLREHKPQDALHTATEPNAALDADLLALAGQASAESGDLPGAITYLERSEQAAPENKLRGLQLASAYLSQHRGADALKLLQGMQVPESLALRREWLLLSALAQAGTPTAVRTEANEYAAANTHNGAALLLAAQALVRTRDIEGARTLINQAAQAEPTSPQPWIALGLLEGSLGNRDPADSAFQHAQQIDPRSVTALLDDARLFLRSGDPARAAPLLAKAKSLAPDNPDVLLLGGALALLKGNGPDAVDHFRKLTSRYPKSAVLQADLARALLLAGRLADARSASADAVTLNPGYWPALELDASLALRARDFDRVAQNLAKMQELKAPEVVISTMQGDLAAAKGDPGNALKNYAEAASAAPSASLAVKMATVRYQLHQPDAAASIRDWLKRFPHDVRTRLVLAQFLQSTGDSAGARQAYETVLTDAPKEIVALNNLAWLRLTGGDTAEGLALAQRAYAIAPSLPAIGDTLGWALVQSGKLADGVAILRSAHQAAPRDMDIDLHYATALLKSGDRSGARSELQKILEGAPRAPQAEQARSMLADLGSAKGQ